MISVLARFLLCAIAAFGALSQPAQAQAIAVARECHAEARLEESWDQVAADPARWKCGRGGWTHAAQAVLIRFVLQDGENRVLPQSITTHTGHFERIDIGLVSRGGTRAWTSHWPQDLRHLGTGPYMNLPLVGVTADTAEIAVRVVRPWNKTTLSEMKLDPHPDGTGWPLPMIVSMAAICGMLLVPLLVNTAFYSVLPERYVIWHLVMVAAMLVQAGVATGFIHLIGAQDIAWEWQLSNMAFATMGAAALMFAANFIEPGLLPRRLKRAAGWLAGAIWATGLLSSIRLELVRPWSSGAMHLVMGLAIAMLCIIMICARMRGSKAVWFQIYGWTPLLVIGSWRVAAYLVPSFHPTEAIVVYQLSLAFEVLVTALGIVSRFVDVRQERDEATARALELEGMAGRDPLTGLRNRRSIERRFEDLFRAGFRTMAVIDLDHFKAVNDTHGHATGDMVLRAAASALAEDRDTRAIRMGGEEFLLLLRGPDAAARAERCRRAISSRIAAEVEGLDRIVTASMGLVEHDTRGKLRIDFATLYARCDQLLYEAKHRGRNCTMREKVTGFQPPLAAAGAA